MYKKDYYPFYTVRHTSCHVLVPSATKRCHVCTEYRKTLHAMYYRRLNQENSMTSDRSNPDSHANYRYLNGSEKNDRLHQLHTKSLLLSQKMKRMLEKLESEIDRNGIELDSGLHEDISAIMDSEEHHIQENYPPGSFQRLFWEQQHKATKMSNSKSMKWAPAMIRLKTKKCYN